MADKDDGLGKGPAKPGADAPGAKKPSAIIDLKAAEVRPPQTDPAAKSGQSGVTAAQVDIKQPATGVAGGASVPPTSKTADKPGVTASPSPAKAQPTATKPASAPRQGVGIAGIATHAFAGLAGGFLALLGADTIGQQIGLPGASPNTVELQRRIAAVEDAAKVKPAATAPDLTQKLAAAEARIAKMEELGRSIPALTESQAKLASAAQQLDQKLKTPAPGADAEKLARLEDTLTTLAAAATADTQKGRIPQLAQITGKLADLEAAFGNQMAAARKSVAQDVESRLGQSTEAAEAARSGVQRLDRDLAAIKTDNARAGQRLDNLDQTVRAAREDTAGLKTAVEGLRGDLTAQLKSVARPQDVSSALAPLTTKLSSVEQNLAGMVKGEEDRKANAERIVLSLELANLKRALDRGGVFATELAEVQKAARGKLDLKALDAFKDKGVPTVTSLATDFRAVAYAIINADAEVADASVVDRLLAGAKSMVRVRKASTDTSDASAEAIAARIEAGLKAGRLAEVADEAKKLSPKAKAAAGPWLSRLEGRASVDRAVNDIETQLKVALGGRATQ